MNMHISSLAKPTLTLVGIGCLWELVCRGFDVPSFLLPTPIEIVVAGLAVDAAVRGQHVGSTLYAACLGFLLAIAVSLPLASLMTRFKLLDECLHPLLIILSSTPIVAIAPILVVTLGATQNTRVVIVALICFFPLVVGTLTGLRSVPAEILELSRSLSAPVRRQYLHIRFPYAISHIFAAMRVAVTLAVIGAVVAEFVAADKGLGYFLRFSTSNFKVAQGFAALGMLIAMSLAFYGVVALIQQLCFPWSLAVESSRKGLHEAKRIARPDRVKRVNVSSSIGKTQ